nr:MAG TPA: Putative head tail adaptor [Caudoviricetes sp.]
MTGRIRIIRKVTSIVDGRRQQSEKEFYSCWCEVKSLNTTEKYEALQRGLENTIVFDTRACKKLEEIRLNLKEFYVIYKGVEFKIYDAVPKTMDNRTYQLKCRAVS